MKKLAGFTLIELMIAMVIGLIILSATIGVYVNTVKGSTATINAARLNHDLEAVMTIMVNDIRRAGYWGGAIAGSVGSANPFTTGTADLQVPTADCVLYTYDVDGDGTLDAGEYFGFKYRVDATSGSGTIKMLYNGTAATCAGAEWNIFTSEYDVNITALTITTTPYKCLNITTASSYNATCAATITAGNLISTQQASESRELNISLTGQLVNDSTVTKTLTSRVKVSNDRVFTQP